MSDISFPLLLDTLKDQFNGAELEKLTLLNNQFFELKQQLKDLNRDKGIFSRRIGAAKKKNAVDEEAITKIKRISVEIKEKDRLIAQLKLAAQSLLKTADTLTAEHLLPGHFQEAEDAFDVDINDFTIIDAHSNNAVAWNAFVDSLPKACIYHRYEFRDIISQSFGHNTFYLAAVDKSNKIIGVLPAVQLNSRIFGNYIVSIPMFNYAGPIGKSLVVEQALIKRVCEIAASAGASHVELRDTRSREGLQQKTAKLSLVLKLPANVDTLWSNLGAKVRSQIKRGEENNLVVKTAGADLLNDFYYVFSRNMRDLGTPVYSKLFFKNIISTESIKSELVVVYHKSKPVSCGFLLQYKNTVEIPWASTLRSANSLNANMFLYWNILKYCIDNGYTFFDFGRSSKDAGTFKFKKQWGAEPIPLYWHYWLKSGGDLPELNPNNPKYRFAIAVWKCLPVWLTKLIGPPLVKNLP